LCRVAGVVAVVVVAVVVVVVVVVGWECNEVLGERRDTVVVLIGGRMWWAFELLVLVLVWSGVGAL